VLKSLARTRFDPDRVCDREVIKQRARGGQQPPRNPLLILRSQRRDEVYFHVDQLGQIVKQDQSRGAVQLTFRGRMASMQVND
jgi:hypothetical protein